MLLDKFFNEEQSKVWFSRQQASDFAKEIARDFNPIHDQDAKTFCVPGDLLFASVLRKYGLNRRMRFVFSGMVGDGVRLEFPHIDDDVLVIRDDKGKEYLTIEREGESTTNADLIADITRSYVEFSGQTFPHILVPLMTEHRVMINPTRPLVVYESMVIELDRLDIVNPVLEMVDASLEVVGKRGNACLSFRILAGGEEVGKGQKNMVLSGLRDLDPEKIAFLESTYNERKQAYGT